MQVSRCPRWLSPSTFRCVRSLSQPFDRAFGGRGQCSHRGCRATVERHRAGHRCRRNRCAMFFCTSRLSSAAVAPINVGTRRPRNPGSLGCPIRSGIRLSEEWGHRRAPGHGHQRLPGFYGDIHLRARADVHRHRPCLPVYFRGSLWPWP
ncbi:hypothetical protein LX32DRAFT_188427 [Colletotrichum zoysiae]|uniref:Uncharacterized protein n=1 Tax=Colletotrichum zoysiae TaxID=1216348 RepID=A0AAD9LVF2_9PEZI|nr:hypothetical protein LX32DRAFT_188427 [Colletotrichum zoysiae]